MTLPPIWLISNITNLADLITAYPKETVRNNNDSIIDRFNFFAAFIAWWPIDIVFEQPYVFF